MKNPDQNWRTLGDSESPNNYKKKKKILPQTLDDFDGVEATDEELVVLVPVSRWFSSAAVVPKAELDWITDLLLGSVSTFLVAEEKEGFLIEGGGIVLVQSARAFLFLLASIWGDKISSCFCEVPIKGNLIGFGGKVWLLEKRRYLDSS